MNSYSLQQRFPIGDRMVGDGRCLVIAEIGPNHNGDSDLAHRLIDAAADAGCDGVKFQHRRASDELFDRQTRSYYYDEPRFKFIERVQEFSEETHRAFLEHAHKRGMLHICSAMCEEAVGRIAALGCDALKIPSGEVGNPWLLERAGHSGLPIIASSGMSPLDEIDEMMRCLAEASDRLVLLHCVSEYPTALEDMNLRLLPFYAKRYNCPVGLSDHSRNLDEVAASVALGAAMIEVHFTFDRDAVGPDHHISLLPEEMAALCRHVRELEVALGVPEKVLGAHADNMRGTFTNSIVTRVALPAGSRLSRETLALKKPGSGMPPTRLLDVLGKQLSRDVPADHPISEGDLAE
ncbi:MAG: N-acetylneuraminate synthase [Alphaproteobacteria bacterium]|nr:N-acetylneuraminate synthase [Alphaproteobacteria bacterium]